MQVRMRYGMDDGKEKTLEDVGQALGVSQPAGVLQQGPGWAPFWNSLWPGGAIGYRLLQGSASASSSICGRQSHCTAAGTGRPDMWQQEKREGSLWA